MTPFERFTQTSRARPDPLLLLNALPQPVLAIDADGAIREVNTAAEHFFDMGRAMLLRSDANVKSAGGSLRKIVCAFRGPGSAGSA